MSAAVAGSSAGTGNTPSRADSARRLSRRRAIPAVDRSRGQARLGARDSGGSRGTLPRDVPAAPSGRRHGGSGMGQRIGIIGAGAIGCVVGGMLSRAGRDVTLIDQWPDHVETIKRHGLRLSGTCGEHVIPVKALHLHEAQGLGAPFDLAFIAVKSYDTE